MKLVRYGAPGAERPGLLDGDILRDLSGVVEDIDSELLGSDFAVLDGLEPSSLPAVPGAPRLGPPVRDTAKIVGVGLNYADHVRELGIDMPPEPALFGKATSAICGPDDDVRIPPGAEKMDWEVELGVVIGAACREITESRAADHIAGYCIVNDVSERAFQFDLGGQWIKGKSADTFAPLGPYLVTREEVVDVLQLDLWTEVNGAIRQNGNTVNMIAMPARLVAYISRFMSLHPGDIIATGTPAGVGFGQTPPQFLQPGDSMRLGITGLGVQQQRVVSATAG